MAVVQVVGKGVEDACLQPQGVVGLDAYLQGQLVRCEKGDEEGLTHQQIGVGLYHRQGHLPVLAVEGHADLQGQVVGGEEVQQPPHGELHAQGLADGLRPLGGDALDPGELLRVLLDDGEDIFPEGVHQPPGGGYAHPLDGPGGQVFQHSLFSHGHPPLHDLRLELFAVCTVAGPLAVDGQALTGADPGHDAHHGDLVPVGGVQAQDRIAVLLVAVDHRGDGSFQKNQFRG